uniref:Cyanocobalamin reductase (cyanide-eliminating) n=1 Tax=Plectus sambesii TaxID=2011161 RepID=A0A914VIR9_9BILA
MCTCGHLTGAAYYYQPSDLLENPWTDGRSVIGVSLHPRYGGYFAFRCVLIFPKVFVSPTFSPPRPLKILESQEAIKTAIEAFNFSWQDARFREYGNPQEKYEELQTRYFSVPPAERWALLKEWFA